MNPLTREAARALARETATEAVGLLAKSINACNVLGRPYQYSQEAIADFTNVIAQIISIVETGDILLTPISVARMDEDFQEFKNKLLGRTGD